MIRSSHVFYENLPTEFNMNKLLMNVMHKTVSCHYTRIQKVIIVTLVLQ